MQDFRDNEKKKIKNDRQLAILEICHGLSLCETSHFVLYAWWWYVMDMWSMREQKFLDQLSCKISEIMRKKNWNGRLVTILDFISAKFVMGYYCVRPSILFYIQGPANLHFFESLKYHKITQI